MFWEKYEMQQACYASVYIQNSCIHPKRVAVLCTIHYATYVLLGVTTGVPETSNGIAEPIYSYRTLREPSPAITYLFCFNHRIAQTSGWFVER